MILKFICHYCNHTWDEYVSEEPSRTKCPLCSDTHVSYKHKSHGKRDYYAGSPEFEEQPGEIQTFTLEDWDQLFIRQT